MPFTIGIHVMTSVNKHFRQILNQHFSVWSGIKVYLLPALNARFMTWPEQTFPSRCMKLRGCSSDMPLHRKYIALIMTYLRIIKVSGWTILASPPSLSAHHSRHSRMQFHSLPHFCVLCHSGLSTRLYLLFPTFPLRFWRARQRSERARIVN